MSGSAGTGLDVLQTQLRDACAAALVAADALALGAVRQGMLVYASPALARTLGLPGLESPRPISEFIAEADRQRVERALATLAEHTVGVRAVRADGSLFEAQLSLGGGELPDGPATAIVLQDVTRLESDPRQLSYAELYDAGTGLPNERLFFDRLQQAVVRGARSGRRVVAVAVEIVGLEPPADAVLRRVGGGLKRGLRETDTVARLDNTTLGVLLPRLASREQAAVPAERMVAAYKDAVMPNPLAGGLALRIGVAAYPDDAPTPELLLEQARVGLREAARTGRAIAYAPAAAVREPPMRMSWNARYEVGIEVIDGQHRQLLELINRLGDDLSAGRDFDQLVESLRELVRYTEHHFATEERLMDEVGAGAERHRSEHRRLIDGLMRYTVSLDAGAVSRSSRFLQDWLFHHINEVDRPFAAFLRSRGVK
jgi:hemerythrin-like metal-binding protein